MSRVHRAGGGQKRTLKSPADRAAAGFEMSFTVPAIPVLMLMQVNSGRLITLVYVILLTALGLGAGALFLDARAEYNQLKQVEAANRRRLAETEARLREQERVLERLRTDPAYVEKVIFQKLHYARPGDVIFRFEN
jgi:cell division protein DivIC